MRTSIEIVKKTVRTMITKVNDHGSKETRMVFHLQVRTYGVNSILCKRTNGANRRENLEAKDLVLP